MHRVLILSLFVVLASTAAADTSAIRRGTDPQAPRRDELVPPVHVVLLDIGNTLVSKGRTWSPGAEEALAILRGAGYEVGVLSNTGNMTRSQLRAKFLPLSFSFRSFPDELINLSSESGFSKPTPGVFRDAARRASHSVDEILFLDERLGHVLAAQTAGMRALLVDVTIDDEGRVTRSNLLQLAGELAAQAGSKRRLSP